MKRMKPTVLILGVFAIFALLTTACVTSGHARHEYYVVKINSIAAAGTDLRGKSYVISSAMQEVNDEDLQFKEFARYIENALKIQGYNRVDSKEKAEILIRLAYGIGDPQTITYTTTTGPGYVYPVGWGWQMVPPTTETVRQTTYQRHLVVEAFDLKTTSARLPQLWKTAASSEGSSSDIRTVLPYMIAAAADNFGTDTGAKVSANISDNDPRVDDIKHGFVDVANMGAGLTRLSDEHARQMGLKRNAGVLVHRVIRNTLAGEMGLKEWDIILTINGKAIREPEDAQGVIKSLKPGEKVAILYWRYGQGKDVKTGCLK